MFATLAPHDIGNFVIQRLFKTLSDKQIATVDYGGANGLRNLERSRYGKHLATIIRTRVLKETPPSSPENHGQSAGGYYGLGGKMDNHYGGGIKGNKDHYSSFTDHSGKDGRTKGKGKKDGGYHRNADRSDIGRKWDRSGGGSPKDKARTSPPGSKHTNSSESFPRSISPDKVMKQRSP
jgi:hypothetical protein